MMNLTFDQLIIILPRRGVFYMELVIPDWLRFIYLIYKFFPIYSHLNEI